MIRDDPRWPEVTRDDACRRCLLFARAGDAAATAVVLLRREAVATPAAVLGEMRGAAAAARLAA